MGHYAEQIRQHHNETLHIIAAYRMATDPKRMENVNHRKREGSYDQETRSRRKEISYARLVTVHEFKNQPGIFRDPTLPNEIDDRNYPEGTYVRGLSEDADTLGGRGMNVEFESGMLRREGFIDGLYEPDEFSGTNCFETPVHHGADTSDGIDGLDVERADTNPVRTSIARRVLSNRFRNEHLDTTPETDFEPLSYPIEGVQRESIGGSGTAVALAGPRSAAAPDA